MSIKNIYLCVFGGLIISLLGAGVFGQGIDVVYSYNIGYTNIWKPAEFVGGLLATLNIFGIYVGVHASALLLFMALARYYSLELDRQTLLYLTIIVLLMLSWPLFLATTNAIRQGLAVIVYVTIAGWMRYDFPFRRWYLVAYLFVLAFSHAIGVIIFYTVIVFYVINKKHKNAYFFSGIASGLLLIFISMLFKYAFGFEKEISTPTGIDARLILSIFIACFLIVYMLLVQRRFHIYERYLLFSSVCILIFSVQYFNYSLEYERLMWIPLTAVFLLSHNLFSVIKPRIAGKVIMLSFYMIYSFVSLYFVGFQYPDSW